MNAANGLAPALPSDGSRPIRLSGVDDCTMSASGTVHATKDVRVDSPYLAAHYPGRAIFPGVFLLDTVLAALDEARGGRPVHLVAVRSMRLLAPVEPPARLTLAIEPGATTGSQQRIKVAASVGDVVVAKLVIDVDESADATPPADPAPEPVARVAGATASVGHAAIRALLPHAHPINLVDRMTEFAAGRYAVALKGVSGAEPCYAGVDPAVTSMAFPRPLLVESFTQAGALLWLAGAADSAEQRAGDLVLAVIRDVQFLSDVRPGDVVRHEVALQNTRGDTAFFTGESFCVDAVTGLTRPVLRIASIVTSVATAADAVQNPAQGT